MFVIIKSKTHGKDRLFAFYPDKHCTLIKTMESIPFCFYWQWALVLQWQALSSFCLQLG